MNRNNPNIMNRWDGRMVMKYDRYQGVVIDIYKFFQTFYT